MCESMWSCLVDWATNTAAPGLTLLRAFSDYELAVFAVLKDQDAFSLPALTQFTDRLKAETTKYEMPCSSTPAATAHFYFSYSTAGRTPKIP